MPVPRRVLAFAAAMGIAAAGAAGCSVPRNERATPPTPTSTSTYALTGLPAPADWRPRPVLTIKIDNTVSGRPQRGVNSADLIIEEPVEGGLTRLAAFYESKLPETVGPVRSARTSDIGLVQPVGASVVASGAAPQVIAAFQAADVPLVDETNPAFTRDPSRSAPYNLFVNPTLLEPKGAHAPTQSYFEFGTPNLSPGASAERATVRYPNSATEQWAWQENRDVWQRDDTADDTTAVTSVLLLTVRLRDAGYNDIAGNPVPEVQSTGRGAGYLLTGGQVHRIAWRKASDREPFEVMTPGGLVIPMPPGRTWLGLLPRGQGKLTYS